MLDLHEFITQADYAPRYEDLEAYYEGTKRLDALGVTLPPKMRVLEMVAPFPRLSVDVLAEILVPAGFAMAKGHDIPDKIREWWGANNLEAEVPRAIREALVQGAAYFIVGHGEDGVPRISVHTRKGISTRYDHMGRLAEAIKRYDIGGVSYAAHYLPGRVDYYVLNGGWKLYDSIDTGTYRPTLIPMYNKVRIDDRTGRSEIVEIATITDAASRSLTNLQVAQETLSMPQRYMAGKDIGKAIAANASGSGDGGIEKEAALLKAYFSALWIGPEGTNFGQLPGADLSQIINSYKLYAQIVSSVTGIPPAMLGISTDNPSSAEALRTAKDRLVTRAEDKQRSFGGAIVEAMRVALDMYDVADFKDSAALELRWRDPADANTASQKAALMQAHAQGIISAETAREGLGLTPEQLAREREEDAREYPRVGAING